MPINKSTEYGNIEISLDAIANLAGGSNYWMLRYCRYGKPENIEGWLGRIIVKRKNYARGVVVTQDETGLVLNLYIIALQGIKLSEVVYEAQKRVKYVLEKTLEVKCNAVNIYVQGVRAVK